MDINLFQDLFVNKNLSLRKIYIIVSIFIISILLIIVFNDNFYDYFEGNASLKNGNVISSVVSIYDLKYIINNKNMMIGGSTFAYKVVKVDDYLEGYKVVSLKLNNYKGIENMFIEYKIIINKDTLLNYLIKSMKGEYV